MILTPRLPADAWTAGAAGAIAILNASALFLSGESEPVALRVRRIALFANGLLFLAAALFVAGSLAHGVGALGLLLSAGLLLPPLITGAALVRRA